MELPLFSALFVSRAVAIALIVVVASVAFLLVRRTARIAVARLVERQARDGTSADLAAAELEKRARTVETLAVRAAALLIFIVAALMVLDQFDVDIGPAIAGLGIAGLAFGLGTQAIVRDWVAGILILMENQFSAGDFVEIAGVSGTVEAISLRRTVVRSVDGTVHSVPNGEIRVASNRTKFWSGIVLDVEVSAERADAVSREIDRIGRELKDDPELGPLVLEPPRVDRITGIGPAGVRLLVLGSVRTGAQTKVSSEVRRRMLDALGPEGLSA